jgi:signal transduction histidine kinase
MTIQNSPLRRKVTLAVFAAIGASLLLAASGLGFFEYRAAELRLRSGLESLAQVSFTTVIPAVEFNMAETAQEALARLERAPLVTAATVYSRRSGAAAGPFAGFVRPGRAATFAPGPRPDGFYLEDGSALLVTTFSHDGGTPVATLQLEGNLAAARRDFSALLKLLGAAFAIVLVIGAILARWLQRAVTRPVLALADCARKVHETGNFQLRAAVASRDEIGELAAGFNEMLEGIARRDRDIAASNALQQAILAGAGVAVISCSPQGVVQSFNPAAEKLLGYTAEEVVGKAGPELWHDPAEVAARAQALSARLGRPVAPGFGAFVAGLAPGGAEGAEWTFVRKDGRHLTVYLVVSELRGRDGALLGYAGLATDLTGRRRRERALQAFTELTGGVTGREFFTATVRHLAAELGVRFAFMVELTTDASGGPAGLTLAAWANGPAIDFMYSLPGTPCEEVVTRGLCHFPDGVAGRFPHDKLLADLHARSYAGVPIRDHDGRTIGLIAVLDDKPMPDAEAASLLLVLAATRAAAEIQRLRNQTQVTQLNAALEARVSDRTAELAARVAEVERLNGEQQILMRDLRSSQQGADRSAARLQEVNSNLLVANQELEAFSYSVSHDLRAPLRNITGFLELLGRRTEGRLDAESSRFVSVVTAEATRMGMLIDDLLTFSRVGRTEMHLQDVDLGRLTASVRDELKSEIGDRAVEWEIGPLPVVRGDPVLLRQVVANLLGNAVKFTRRCPVARIEVGFHPPTAGDRTVTLFVRDNGAGFNPKYLGKLFGVFQRLHNSRDFEGTGIGLANVKRIVTRHGGRVWAEGQIDRGAVFCFTLTLAQT